MMMKTLVLMVFFSLSIFLKADAWNFNTGFLPYNNYGPNPYYDSYIPENAAAFYPPIDTTTATTTTTSTTTTTTTTTPISVTDGIPNDTSTTTTTTTEHPYQRFINRIQTRYPIGTHKRRVYIPWVKYQPVAPAVQNGYGYGAIPTSNTGSGCGVKCTGYTTLDQNSCSCKCRGGCEVCINIESLLVCIEKKNSSIKIFLY